MCTLPFPTVPFSFAHSDLNLFHWLVTLLPLSFLAPPAGRLSENMTVLYPLHVCTIRTIEFLTTTSLDPAEQQLLAVALIDLYIFAGSPQMVILKAILWLGATLLFVVCQGPLRWELSLARIPSWRFRESNRRPRSTNSLLQTLDRSICGNLAKLVYGERFRQVCGSGDDEDVEPIPKKGKSDAKLSISITGLLKHTTSDFLDHASAPIVEPSVGVRRGASIESAIFDHEFPMPGRHTMPTVEPSPVQNYKSTPSGRSKRSTTARSQSFLAWTPAQVAVRKWAYATFVYAAVLFIVLGPTRIYVRVFSLGGVEPFGWALGYLLGDIPRFRAWLSLTGRDTWIPLADRFHQRIPDQMGCIERLRQNTLGPANMRLLLCLYCLLILLAGMATVLRLSSIVEVDTRRKVFHGTMVTMLLPTVFIDPCFISLALILILAMFLLLDLFRASQLPPISKPLSAFLAPYVDGRDHRGPIVVSHIFLLIGCAIPLWLSLAAIPRSGQEPWAGWEVNARDVSMVSGVVCVGMGDSAASLVGRRYGRHKWYWGGGKSLEGSLAFAAAVTVGLIAAHTWLRTGGWVLYDGQSPAIVLGKAFLAATGASLTEAVLTGANDNVVVPVVLWLLVRGLRF